jgi:hypothetical protein
MPPAGATSWSSNALAHQLLAQLLARGERAPIVIGEMAWTLEPPAELQALCQCVQACVNRAIGLGQLLAVPT